MNNHSPSPLADTISSILLRIRKQDPDAWLKLVEWIGPFILNWCRRTGLQAADCDDVSQSVLQKIWSSFGAFRKEKPGDSFRGWVYVITRNQCRDFLAKQHAGKHTLLDVTLPAQPDPHEAPDLQQRAIWLLLQDVIARNRDDAGFKAFYRTAVDGLSATETAAELGLKKWTVRQHKCRWVKRLRDQLSNEFGELLG